MRFYPVFLANRRCNYIQSLQQYPNILVPVFLFAPSEKTPILPQFPYRHLFLLCRSSSDEWEEKCQNQRRLCISVFLTDSYTSFYFPCSFFPVRESYILSNYLFSSISPTAGSHRSLWTIMTTLASVIELLILVKDLNSRIVQM